MSHIIPVPKKYDVISESFHSVPLSIYTEVAGWQDYLDAFRQTFRKIFEVELPAGVPGGIELILDETVPCDAYILDTQSAVEVRSGGSEGMLYGLATVLQLVKPEGNGLNTPSVHVEDHPDKEFRAFMLDPGFAVQPFRQLNRHKLCALIKNA